MTLERIGHIRPQPGGTYGGIVDGLGGSSGDDIVGVADPEAAKDLAVARAKELGWSPPYRWTQQQGDAWILSAQDPSPTAPEDSTNTDR